MAWNDIGFNESLVREDTVSTQQELDPLQFEQFAPELSASKLIGLMQSQDGQVQINLDENYIFVSDGVIERVRLGKQSDGSYGLVVKDVEGNILLQFTGNTNLIQSSNKHMILDFILENLSVYNDGDLRLVSVGKISE